MKSGHIMVAVAALALTAWASACQSNKVTEPAVDPAIDALRSSLAPYTSLANAKAQGYNTAITDCMSNGDLGAMGVHFGNVALIDGTADAKHPEILIYEPGSNGDMSLVGVEFIIPFAVLPKSSPAPVLFGQKFQADDAFALWGLHVWTQRSNPSGLFSPWNPRVHC